MMKSVLFVLSAFVLLALAQQPITKTQFTAAYLQTATISMSMPGSDTGMPTMPPMTGKIVNEAIREARAVNAVGDITITTKGNLYYDSIARRMRTDVSSLSFDFGAGSPIVSNAAMTSLILYDLGKNFTFDKNSCDCDAVTEDFPILYLTPDVVETFTPSVETITVNGVQMTVNHTSSTVFFGGVSTKTDFYVSGNNLVRSAFAVDAMGSKINYSFDFWNVQNLPNPIQSTFQESSLCKCPAAAAPVIDTTATFPTTCGTAIDGCDCATQTLPDTAFCKSAVTYQISANTFADFTDGFVKSTFDSSVSLMSPAPSDNCKTVFKNFLCNFYFPQCLANGDSKKPVQPDFDAVCGSSASAAKNNDANSVYKTAAATKEGGKSTSSASSVALSFVAVVAVFVALF